tara:strand:- start:396 stop:746 length:351 start_codon:yes stop_codon:yes gene_type:complete
MSSKVVALVPFNYGGVNIDRGEIFDLRALPNDDKLLGNKFVRYYEKDEDKQLQCDTCGRRFGSDVWRRGHKAKKGGCPAIEQKITDEETAVLLDREPDQVRIDDSPVKIDETTEII